MASSCCVPNRSLIVLGSTSWLVLDDVVMKIVQFFNLGHAKLGEICSPACDLTQAIDKGRYRISHTPGSY